MINKHQIARVNLLKRIMQDRKFPEITAEKAKLITKTISTRNSTELIKSEQRGAA